MVTCHPLVRYLVSTKPQEYIELFFKRHINYYYKWQCLDPQAWLVIIPLVLALTSIPHLLPSPLMSWLLPHFDTAARTCYPDHVSSVFTQSWQFVPLSSLWSEQHSQVCNMLPKNPESYQVLLLPPHGRRCNNLLLLWRICLGMPQTTGSPKIMLMWQAPESSKGLSPAL